MTAPADLIAKIHTEIAEDIELVHGEDEQEHTQRHWPDRIERQADAFKRILERHRSEPRWDGLELCARCSVQQLGVYQEWPCPEVLDLAAVYDIRIGAARPPVAQVVTETSSFGPVVFEQLGFGGER